MEDGTQSASLFTSTLLDLIRKLECVADDKARALVVESRQLLAMFEGWAQTRPAQEERIARINQLFDLQRRSLEYLSGCRTKDATGSSHRPKT